MCCRAEFGFSALKGVGKGTRKTPKCGAVRGTPLSWDGRRGGPKDTRPSLPTRVTPSNLVVLRQRMYVHIVWNPQNREALGPRPLGVEAQLT